MSKQDSYLILDEYRNTMDYLIQSLTFLSQVEQNNYYWKWFVIAFHASIHSFMLLVLQKADPDLIYKHEKVSKQKAGQDGFNQFEKQLRNFMDTYSLIKDSKHMKALAYIADELQDEAMKELNNKLRNQFIHFKPMHWAAEAWYPAHVCYPLLSILRFCLTIEGIGLNQSDIEIASSYIDSIDGLLIKHKGKT